MLIVKLKSSLQSRVEALPSLLSALDFKPTYCNRNNPEMKSLTPIPPPPSLLRRLTEPIAAPTSCLRRSGVQELLANLCELFEEVNLLLQFHHLASGRWYRGQ